MSDTEKKSGLGLVGAVQTVFIINKLTDAGDIAGWSWWWVLSPLWITTAVALALLLLGGLIMWVAKLFK